MIPPCIPVIRLGLAILGSSVCLTTSTAQGAAQELRIEIRPQFSRAPLILDTPGNLVQPGQTVSVTRLDFLLSNFALRSTHGVWFYSSNRFAHISIRDGKTSFVLRGLAKENVDRIRFHVGVPPKENHASPGQFDAHHPLNPNLNGLHWDWEGGYVFVAVEGMWKERSRGYSFHIATDAHLMTVELPVRLQTDQASSLQISFNVDGLFSHPNEVRLTDETLSTHSRAGDPVAHKLRINIEHAFEAIGTLHPSTPTRSDADSAGTISRALVSSQATPHRFAFPSYYPQPALPLDNPLTLQGIALGQRLFEDPQLSASNKQSCASCHQAASGFADAGKRYSVGADGRVGTRNTMPLFNLAWRHSFFWDGRAATLREQVLQPIEN
ncbi:MAG: hypothetical protein FJ405_14480, partial [Verrucomicrobia bacterium]|nr:hypothetical protein [Verrucomicrobiota bacterium]